MECPTVRIKATTGSYPFTTINEADFDPAKHVLYAEGEVIVGTIETRPDDAADGVQIDAQDLAPIAPAAKRGRK